MPEPAEKPSLHDHSHLPVWPPSLLAVHSGLASLHSYHLLKDLFGNLEGGGGGGGGGGGMNKSGLCLLHLHAQ